MRRGGQSTAHHRSTSFSPFPLSHLLTAKEPANSRHSLCADCTKREKEKLKLGRKEEKLNGFDVQM
jgi:hypothetical protein